MPIDYSKYSADWHELSKYIRFERAGNRCEECGVPNNTMIVRSSTDGERYMLYDSEADHWLVNGEPVRLSEIPAEYQGVAVKVILTVAHLDHDVTNNDHDNLKSMCQRCHNRYDAPMRKVHAKATRADKKTQAREDAGQGRLL